MIILVAALLDLRSDPGGIDRSGYLALPLILAPESCCDDDSPTF